MSALSDRLEKMLAAGQDTALLRFSLGNAHLNENPGQAAVHLAVAVTLDPAYSAAWKILGKALALNDDTAASIDAYERGIEVATRNGDKQAAKEMSVFLKRLKRAPKP